jgi:integrase
MKTVYSNSPQSGHSAGRIAISDLVRVILDGGSDKMPRKYQNPKLEIRSDVKRPYYFVRVTVPKITTEGRRLKREAKILGFVDKISIKDARKLRASLLEVVNAGRVLVQSQIRFKDVARRFQDVRLPQLGFATQKKYNAEIENHILPAFGELRMCDIDRPAVEAWLNAKAIAGLGWWSRVDLKGVLSAIFTAANDWKLWEGENPTMGVRVGRKKLVREKRLLTAEQLRTILAALAERERFIVLLLFGLGLRISEALGLRWSDVDLAAGTIAIRRRWYRGDLGEDGDTKSAAGERKLQLGRALADEFKQRNPGVHRHGEFVFLGDDGRLPPDDRDLLRECFRPVVKRLGLWYKGFGWHAFRRQNVTWRQHAGATPTEAMRAAGHSSMDMTLLYTLSDAERERSQVDAMFERLMEMPEGKPQ